MNGEAARDRSRAGAFVCSLDLELYWGVRDRYPPDGGAYRANLLGERRAVPAILEVFRRHDISATWATVGLLFARTRDEMRAYWPEVRPRYARAQLSPYGDAVGRDERDDPLRFAPSLLEEIRRTPGQEIATHTFSHYYCLEPGQTREAFAQDLDSAVRIAASRGVRLRSIVFPCNQVNPDYADLLLAAGIATMRGNERSWLYRPDRRDRSGGALRRAGRLLDSYVGLSGSNAARWEDLADPAGLCNVPSSQFLRPWRPELRHLERQRLRRIAGAIRSAAREGRVYHLWWHPHNFGRHLAENLRFLEDVLETVAECRERFGMRSLSMEGVAAHLAS